ncbi:MarR family winged helix-turn-helix transcriptional regulator [candidate division KSB1 bacterium]
MDTELREFDVPCTWFNIRKASRAITQYFDHTLQPTGLRITQLNILYLIKVSGPVMLTQIANMLVVDRTTLTRNLRLLEQNGYITSTKAADKRKRLFDLTELGEKKIDEALPLWKEANSYFVRGLGIENWNSMLKNLCTAVSLVR